MSSQDNKMASISTGQDGHEVHLCRRCGWPFPNPHPSARHRRAHKKLCGTIEGYKTIDSEELVSDDDHASDEDEHTTPSNPKVVKKTAEELGSSGRVGARSNKSEDDVYADAVTEFSDSGISPRLEERFESVRELDKILEQKRLESHLSEDVEKTADTTEQVNDQTKSAEGASVGLITVLQPDLVESEIVSDKNITEHINGESLQGQPKDKSAPTTLDPEKVRISDQTEKREDLCEKSVSDQTEKKEESCENSVSDQTERTLQNSDASAETSGPVKTVSEIALSVETRENCDAYVAVNTSPEESLLSTPSVKSDGLTEQSEAKPVVSSTEIEVNENRNLEDSKGSCSVDTVLIQPESVVEVESKDVDHSEDKSSCEILGTRTEKVEGAPVGPTMPSNDSTDLSSSREAADLLEPSKTEYCPPEHKDNGFDKKTFERLDTVYFDMGDMSELEDNNEAVSSEGTTEQQITKELVDATKVGSELNALPVKEKCLNETPPDKSEAVSSEGTTEQQITKELVDATKVGTELNALPVKEKCLNETSSDNSEAVSSEGTTEQKITKELVDATKVGTELNALPVKEKCLNETTPDVEDGVPPLDVQKDSNETCVANNSVINVDTDVIVAGVDSKHLQAEVDDEKKLTSDKVGVADSVLSGHSSRSRDDSLEENCAAVSDTLETDSQKPKATTEEAQAHHGKSDTFDAPSFMTLVQSGGEANGQVSAVSEIETVKNNQQPKTNAPEVGWFPSLTNVLNESEGRKKNEEIIAKVTKWSPGKQHGPLKNLLNDVKSPDMKQVNDHETDESKNAGAGADVATINTPAVVVGPTDPKDAQAKDVEQWNSPARYPIEIKKETKKKKGRSLWVPFVCCSSVHRDL